MQQNIYTSNLLLFNRLEFDFKRQFRHIRATFQNDRLHTTKSELFQKGKKTASKES